MNTLDFRKRAIMSTLGNVEKTVKVEGDKTIKFSNDTDYKITNFKLYGWTNEIGEGEKSPDNPYTFEHYENPSITVRGSNLLNAKNININTQQYKSQITYTDTGIFFKGSCYSPFEYYDLTDVLKPNTKYYIHYRRILTLNDGTPYYISNSTASQISGYAKLIIDGSGTDLYVPYINNISGSDIEVSKSFTTPDSWTSFKLQTYGTSWIGNLEDGSTIEDTSTMNMELRDIWIGTEPFEKYEKYKEPKTIQLSDVVLRGIKCGHNEQNSSIKAEDIALKKEAIEKDLWQGYMTSDEVFYWADNIEYNNGMLLKSNNTRVYKPTGITYIGDPNYKYTIEDITIYVYMLLIEQGTATYQGATTEIAKEDGISSSVAILGCRATHFENSLENYYTRKVSPYPYMFGLGGVSGSYVSFLSFRLPETVGNTQENANAYLKALFKETSDLYLLVPQKTADDNLSDTNATALKQLLSQSFSGTTIIETNGYIKAEFKYKE